MIPNFFYAGRVGPTRQSFFPRPFWNFFRYGLGSWQLTTGWLWWCLQIAHDPKLPKDLTSIRCPDCGELGSLYFGLQPEDPECVEASCPCGGGFASYDPVLAKRVQKVVSQRQAFKGATNGAFGTRA